VQKKKRRVLGLWERPDIKFTEQIVTKEALNNAIASLPEEKERVELANLCHEEKLYYIMKEKSELFPHCKSLPSQDITLSHCIKLDEEEKKATQLTGTADDIRQLIGRHINIYQRDRSKDLCAVIDKRRDKLSHFVNDVIYLDRYLAKQKHHSCSPNKKNKKEEGEEKKKNKNKKKKGEKGKDEKKKTGKKSEKKAEKKAENVVDDEEKKNKSKSRKRKRQEKRKIEKLATETEKEKEIISAKEEEEEEEEEEEKVDYKRIRTEPLMVENADKEEDKEEKDENKKTVVEEDKEEGEGEEEEEEEEEEKKKETEEEEPFRKLPIMIDSLNEKSLRTYELQKSWLQKLSIV
jgi:hypothetical protein